MILCCGEALIDMIPDGGGGFVPHNGGAIFNTAIGLGRLGVNVGMLSGLSTDMFGEQLRLGLTKSGVDVSHVISSDRPTTLAFVRIVDGHAQYLFYDENSAGRMLSNEALPEISPDISALYFGGISLACEPCGDVYAGLFLDEAPNHVAILDPNIRSSFIANEAAYRDRIYAMISVADIVKVSDEDLDWLDHSSATTIEKAQVLVQQGPSIVILTLGGEGAIAFQKDRAPVQVDAPEVEVIDTVGAGDTFNAGFIASLSEQDLLSKEQVKDLPQDALRMALLKAVQVAAATVSRPGADPPWKDELNEVTAL